jgi:hypothetical protein
MEKVEAEIILRSLVGRLKSVDLRYDLPGGAISALEMDALRFFSGMSPAGPGSVAPPGAASKDALAELNVSCLTNKADESAILCIDFGTAYSKAAVWRAGASIPTPLDLERGANPDRTGVLLDSAAYITEERIFFGPAAVERARLEDLPDRRLFSSPKELLTHDVSRLDVERPPRSEDPTGIFTSRALLTLYLGYLTAVACAVLPDGIGRTVKRRYAAPGWNNAQADTTSAQMGVAARSLGDLLVDAQILADTVEISEWREGLSVTRAAALDNAIRASRSSRGARAFPFIERAVLEAVAAGSGIRDRFPNKRPQVLVIDVGAGTTDIGVFKYVNAADGHGVCAPYAGGMRAVQTAGNRLDEALVGLATRRLELPADTAGTRRFQRRVNEIVRSAKAQLCETGAVEIEIPDFPKTTIELPEFLSSPIVGNYVSEFRKAVAAALEGSGASFRSFSDDSVAVFTGGGGSLPFLRDIFDKKPVELEAGPAYFAVDDAVPNWVERTTPDVSQVFPQVAVATGGCSPYLPDEAHTVRDTSDPGKRSIAAIYKN